MRHPSTKVSRSSPDIAERRAFFRSRGEQEAADKAAARWEDEVVLSGYYTALAARLDSLYQSTPDSAALAAGRASIAAWAREQLQGPIAQQLRSYRIGRISERPINNAQIISARIYRTRLDLFDRWYQKEGQDIKLAVKDLKAQLNGVTGDSAFAVLEQAVNGNVNGEWEFLLKQNPPTLLGGFY